MGQRDDTTVGARCGAKGRITVTFEEAIQWYNENRETSYDGRGRYVATPQVRAFAAVLQKVADLDAKIDRLGKAGISSWP